MLPRFDREPAVDISEQRRSSIFRAKQSMNCSSAGIHGYIIQVWMIWVATGRCDWWTNGGQQSITFQKTWLFQVKLKLKYITSKWYSKDTGEVIPVHNKVSCYEEVWENGTVGWGLHSLSIWWRLSGQLLSWPLHFQVDSHSPPKSPLIGGEVVPSGGMENGEEKNLTNLFWILGQPACILYTAVSYLNKN
jgi:hypothetical protein